MKKCIKCGNMIEDNACFCNNCGKEFELEEKHKQSNQVNRTYNTSKKLKRKWIIGIIIVLVLFIGVIILLGMAHFLFGGRLSDSKLEELIPESVLTYKIDDVEYVSEISDFKVEKGQRKSNKEYEAYCEIRLHDENMDRIEYYVLVCSKNSKVGWQIKNAYSYKAEEIKLNRGYDLDKLENSEYITDDMIFESDDSTYQNNTFKYKYRAEKDYKYLVKSDIICVSGKLIVYDDEVFYKEYRWDISSENDGIKYDFKTDLLEGKWSAESSDIFHVKYIIEIVSIFEEEVEWNVVRSATGSNSEKTYAKNSGKSEVTVDSEYISFDFSIGEGIVNYHNGYEGCTVKVSIIDWAKDMLEFEDSVLNSYLYKLESNSADESAEEGILSRPSTMGETLYIYSFNTEVGEMICDFRDKYPEYDNMIEFVNMAMAGASSEYVDAINEAFISNKVPGMVACDESLVNNFFKEDTFISMKRLGITDEMYKNAYPYTIRIGTNNNQLTALTWQATPGCFAYRADIAREVFGSDDSDFIQGKMKDWNSFLETAEELKQKGYYMLSGNDDLPDYSKYSHIDKSVYNKIAENNYTKGTTSWGDDWYDDMNGNVFGYFGCSWFVSWGVLDEEEEWKVCKGPHNYYWGGTFLGITNECTNKELAAFILYTVCCDEDFMYEYAKNKCDFPNNTNVASKIGKEDISGYYFYLNGQNPYLIYDEMGNEIK